MDATSHNLLEAYYHDGGNTYHYNSLQSGDNHFRVDFTRTVANTGITVTINQIKPVNNGSLPTSDDTAFLTSELNKFQGVPLNGNECITLGWTYLGNWSNNQANIEAAIADCASKGHTFQSLFYQSGYFVYGCVDDKLFYDKN
jgi:hypothetical protein